MICTQKQKDISGFTCPNTEVREGVYLGRTVSNTTFIGVRYGFRSCKQTII